jgi:hypothetical protein
LSGTKTQKPGPNRAAAREILQGSAWREIILMTKRLDDEL